MTIYSDPKFSMMEFNDPPQPLPDHAMNVRKALEFYHFNTPDPFDPTPDSFRYSEEIDVTHATAVLLDALVIPYYMYHYYHQKYRIEFENYPVEGINYDCGYCYHIFDLLNTKINGLINWRRKTNGSLIFITNEGEVSIADIGIVIAKSDVDRFYEIVAELTVKYGYMNRSISELVSIKRKANEFHN